MGIYFIRLLTRSENNYRSWVQFSKQVEQFFSQSKLIWGNYLQDFGVQVILRQEWVDERLKFDNKGKITIVSYLIQYTVC